MADDFNLGDRVRISPYGKQHMKRSQQRRLGTIVRRPNNTSKVSVRWDGLKTEALYPRASIEKVSDR